MNRVPDAIIAAATIAVLMAPEPCVFRCRGRVWIYSSLTCVRKQAMVVVTVQGAPWLDIVTEA